MSTLRERLEGLVAEWHSEAEEYKRLAGVAEHDGDDKLSFAYSNMCDICNERADSLAAAIAAEGQESVPLVGAANPIYWEGYNAALDEWELRAAAPSLHKEQHKFPEYPHDDPTVLAIERGYRKWEEESGCHEIGCGCVTVWIWRELAALHKEGAGGDAQAYKDALTEACSEILRTVMEAMADPEGGIGIDQVYALVDGHIGHFVRASPAGRAEQERKP